MIKIYNSLIILDFLHYRYDAIFYTDNQPFQEHILKRHLLPHGSYVSTVPEQLTSDSLGFICGSIFAGCVRVKLLVQVYFNSVIITDCDVVLSLIHILNCSICSDLTCTNGRKEQS